MSPRATKTLPDVEPILITPRRDPFDDPAWLFEPKYDGFGGSSTSVAKAAGFGPSGGKSSGASTSSVTGSGRSSQLRRRSWTARWWRSTAKLGTTGHGGTGAPEGEMTKVFPLGSCDA